MSKWICFKEVSSAFTLVLLTDTAPSSEVAGLPGFLASVAKEIGCQMQYFQFEKFELHRDRPLIEMELRSPHLQTVRFAGGKRFNQVFEIIKNPTPHAVPSRVAAIGGASGVTFEILKSWVSRGCQVITVMGRRPREDVQASLEELTRLGAKVEYVTGDSTKLEDLEKFVSRSVRDGKIELLIQGAGIECSALVSEQDEFVAEEQVQVKLTTARNLSDLSARYPMQKVIAFSSTAGEFGNAGQSVYAYANMAMAREFELLRERGLDFSIVSWPAWDRVGMTAKESIAQALKLTGLHLLSIERANELFLCSLSGLPHAVCMDQSFKSDRNLEMVRMRALQSLIPHISNLSFPLLLDNWTSKDLPGLRDHLIMDQSLIPVSLPLSLFWHLAYLIKGQPCRVENVEALSFMVLHRRDSPYLLEAELDEQLSLEIRSNESHVRAVANSTPTKIAIPAYHESAQFAHIDMFKQSYSRFGSRLHLLEKVRTTADDRAYAIVDLSKHTLFPNHDSMNRQVVLFEALFHLSGAASEAKTGKVSVPLSFEKVAVFESIMVGEKFQLVVECRYPTEDVLEADLYVYNENGDPCIAITNERLRLFQDVSR